MPIHPNDYPGFSPERTATASMNLYGDVSDPLTGSRMTIFYSGPYQLPHWLVIVEKQGSEPITHKIDRMDRDEPSNHDEVQLKKLLDTLIPPQF